jgi:hypothetical protein
MIVGGAGPPVGKPTLSQTFDMRSFAKGVGKDIKKMIRVAIEETLSGAKVLNKVIVRTCTIGDVNKTVGDISSTIELTSFAARCVTMRCMLWVTSRHAWQQKIDARLDELDDMAMGVQQKLRLGARHPPHFLGIGPCVMYKLLGVLNMGEPDLRRDSALRR